MASTPWRNGARLLILGLVGLWPACSGPADRTPVQDSGYTETGDLDEITRRGTLRILMPPRELDGIPRRGYSIDHERELAGRLARELGLDPEVVTVGDRARMLQDLLDGRGDLVVARLTATEDRRERLGFSIPLDYVREVLACRADDPSIQDRADLAGKRVAVRASSSYYRTLLDIRKEVPEIEIVTVDETLDTEEILNLVAQGEYDATVADNDIFNKVHAYVENLRTPLTLTDARPVAWAIRPDNPRLKQAVDQFLNKQALTRGLEIAQIGDLGEIRRRGVLRVLTLNGAASYFLHRGEEMGFEFELASRFAGEIGCRIQVLIPPRADLLIPWLLGGKGDLIAASMTVTEERRKQIAFTRPYNWVSEIVVARAGDPVSTPDELAGRELAVRRSSSYHQTLRVLRPRLGFEIVEAPENLTTENLIGMIASGEYDLTVSDSNILDVELTYRDDVRGVFPLGESEAIAWMVRPRDRDLLEAADAFLEREYRGTFYNVIKKRYFEDNRRLATMVSERPARGGAISPYDDLFREYGDRIEIDWRLLAAQAYEESGFDPEALSWAGAQGVMQVLPRTAGDLGIHGDLHDPEVGILAGALYLRWLYDLFEPSLPRGERLRLALASYNAGRGHIQDGRRVARSMGLDPDRWFGNVEQALPLLSREQYASRARFGYCRCRQPVAYVRRINQRYNAYIQAVE
jgi:membrane-bound lytic murein transglycosylase F